MRRVLLIFFLLGSTISFAAPPVGRGAKQRAPGFDPAQKKLLTPKLDHAERAKRMGLPTLHSWGSTGSVLKRELAENTRLALRERMNESVARLTDLDPQHTLLTAAEMTDLHDHYQKDTRQITNAAEQIEFGVTDYELNTRAVEKLEEVARGRLAKTLASALEHETASPERLQAITSKLAAQHPFLGSPFKVEMLIADMRKIQPTLAAWDFREAADGRTYRQNGKLPESTQAAITRIGHRAFEGTNVLFANHMYKDSLTMVDSLTALGLDVGNARFVATPYPFKQNVRRALELRGMKVEAAPYSVEETKKMVGRAVEDLLVKARANHGPIVVYDDGGMATEYIAKNHAEELFRFRIVEITKAGERVGKTVLPNALGSDVRDHVMLDAKQSAAARAKFIDIRTIDDASKESASNRWNAQWNARNVRALNPRGQLPRSSFGFAYYTYSDTQYKREVMTPLYTEQVNSSLFSAIERGGKPVANKRVAIVGGGAMGIASGRELRQKGYDVTFVDTNPERIKLLAAEGFAVAPLHEALPGRAIVLEMSGIKNIIGLDELRLVDDGAYLAHGSSKDNPFDMDSFRAMAKQRVAWPDHEGQRSASYTFKAAGISKTIHMPGDGFTISHGGKAQNVALEDFAPELNSLVNLGVYALENKPVTYYPMFSAPAHAMDPTLSN